MKAFFQRILIKQPKSSEIQLSDGQLEQIRLGREEGLSEKQIQFYAKPDIDPWEMWDLREKLFYIPDVPFLMEKYRPEECSVGQARYSGWLATMGGICGDIAGSRYEFNDCDRSKVTFDMTISPHSCFTDDTILMMATLEAVGNPGTDSELRQLMMDHANNFTEEALPFGETEYTRSYKKYFKLFPNGGYGPGFYQWGFTGKGPYRSYGNGSAMRVAPIGEAFDCVDDVILHAIASAACTHNHPEGIKGAVVTAVCIWMGRHGCSREAILSYVKKHYENQDLIRRYTMDEVRRCNQRGYAVSCQFSVPAAVTCFIESNSYESCITNALSFEGDSDTIAAISGAMAAAYYGNVSECIRMVLHEKLPDSLLTLLDPLGKGE